MKRNKDKIYTRIVGNIKHTSVNENLRIEKNLVTGVEVKHIITRTSKPIPVKNTGIKRVGY